MPPNGADRRWPVLHGSFAQGVVQNQLAKHAEKGRTRMETMEKVKQAAETQLQEEKRRKSGSCRFSCFFWRF